MKTSAPNKLTSLVSLRLAFDRLSQAGSLRHFVMVFAAFCALVNVSAQTSTGAEVEVQECVVRFAQEVKVPALETGRVAEVTVAPNDMIEAGVQIARLDDRTLLIRRRASLLRRNSAKSHASDDVELRYAELALAEARVELETSRSIQNDVLGAVPLSQVRKLKLAVERGELEVAQAKKSGQRAEVEAALREADLSLIEDQLRNLQLETPISGAVLEVTRSAGEWIEKGDTIATIARIDRLHVHALLNSEKISPAACRGLPVSVHWTDPSDGAERSLRGKVLSVDPQMLPGGRLRLHAEIVNGTVENDRTQWLLRPGAEVRMKVYTSVATANNASQSSNR
jgi:multidrug efflux pump subunit AcrA (membrane-fusion protein)